MAPPDTTARPPRETRLLVFIVTVSIAVLLLLARLRYPSTDGVAPVTAPVPLATLSAPVTFGDLTDAMRRLLTRVSPRLLIVELAATTPPPARAAASAERTTLVLGLRMRPDLALVAVPAGFAPRRIVGSDAPATVAVADPARHLALLRTDRMDLDGPIDGETFAGLEYVAVVEATAAGPTITPLFAPRTLPLATTAWPGAIYGVAGRPQIPDGSMVFGMDGRFLGLAIIENGSDALVPPIVLNAVVSSLAEGGGSRP